MKTGTEQQKKTLLPASVRYTVPAATRSSQSPVQLRNDTGLPDSLKAGVEKLSGISLDDVNVHYNSAQPAQLQAHAYAQGTDIHLAPGQEKHLPHEAWHVVQQKQGRVKPTAQMNSPVIQPKLKIKSGEGEERVEAKLEARDNEDRYIIKVLEYLKRLAAPYGDKIQLIEGNNRDEDDNYVDKEVTVQDLGEGEQPSKGFTLLSRIIKSAHMVVIDPWQDELLNNVKEADIPKAKDPTKGAGSTVAFPMVDIPTTRVQGEDGEEEAATPAHIALGHELIHADHAQRGTWKGDDNTLHHFTDVPGTQGDYAVKEEMNTVGLGGAGGGEDITENDLRAEGGLAKRVTYHAPDMFDTLKKRAYVQQAKKRIPELTGSSAWLSVEVLCKGGYIYQKPHYFALDPEAEFNFKGGLTTISNTIRQLMQEQNANQQYILAQQCIAGIRILLQELVAEYNADGAELPEDKVPKNAVYSKTEVKKKFSHVKTGIDQLLAKL